MSGAHDLEATSFASPVMPAIAERLKPALCLESGAASAAPIHLAAGLPAQPLST